MKELLSRLGQRLFTPPVLSDQDKTQAAKQIFLIVQAFVLSVTYFIVVFIAGMLLGKWRGIAAAGLCSAATLFIAMTSPARSSDPLRFWLINTLFLVIVILLQNLASRSIRESLEEAKRQLRERRQADSALARSEQKHREMVNSLPFCVFEADLRGRLTFVNQTGLKWFRYDEDEIRAGLNMMQVVPDWERQRLKENLQRITSGEEVSYHEYEVRRKDGSHFPALTMTRRIVEDGIPVALQGSLIDISDRKQAEIGLQMRENMLSSIFRVAPIGIGVVRDRVLTMVNSQICEMTGRTQEELIGKSARILYPSDADFEFVGREKYRQIADWGTGTVETRWQRKDGRIIDVLLSSTPIDALDQSIGVTFTALDITERKRAEEALLASNQFISSLLRALPVAVFFKDKNGKYTGCNDAFSEIMGVTSEEIFGKTVHEIWPSELADTYHQKDIELMRERKHQVYEYQVKDKHGRMRPVIYAKDVFFNADGQMGGLVGAFLDISDRKQAEEALRESEEKYRQTMNVAPIGIYVIQDMRFKFVNPEMARLHGYEAEEMIDSISPPDALVAPEYRETVRQILLKRQNGVRGMPYEIKALRKDGSMFDAMVWGQGISYKGNPASVGSLLDITELKQAEESLKESEYRYRTLFESASDSIFVMKDNLFFDCNSKTMEMFGCRREQIIGVSPDKFSPPLQPDGRNSREKALEKITAAYSGTPQTFEWQHCKADDTPFMAEVSLNRFELGSGFYLLAIVRDITAHNLLEEQLRQAQKMEAVGILAGGVAHDFNNILSSIVGYASLLQMLPGLDKKVTDYLERILASTERAASLTHSLLAFSRKQAIELQPVDVNEAISGFHKVLTRLIGEDIDFRLELAGETLVVDADIRQIEQVLMNLATNSRDAMPNGGRLTIATRSAVVHDERGEIPMGAYAVISVSDTGTGMNSEIRSHLFEPFFTTKEVGKGTGLGLAIVYGIIKNHRGFIRIESEAERSTAFHLYLPLNPLAVRTSKRKKKQKIPRGDETILLVEDDAAVRHATRSVLEEFGYTVLEAADGIEALAIFAAQRDRIDLLVCDLIMPKINGQETRAGILKMKPDVRTLFISGYTNDIIASKGIADPGVHLLLKPLHPAKLLEKVREVLDA
ncbi:MAG: PAS domain S-box protein [Candidatus Aminicenantes bacterium]|nr:PAS domain S-box protein [Candidatus Aminicenantes bacterium]